MENESKVKENIQENSQEVTPKQKKPINIKFILGIVSFCLGIILIVLAIVFAVVKPFSNNSKDSSSDNLVSIQVTDDNGELVTDEKGNAETILVDPLDIIEVTDDEGNVVTDVDGNPETYIVIDGTGYVDNAPETSIVVKEGETKWPSSLPKDIPVCKINSFCNNCFYQENDNEENWFMSWYASSENYESWMTEVEKTFAKSNEVVGYYGNGKILLDITTEEQNDGVVWVSMDATKTKPVSYPSGVQDNVPSIETSATLWGWEVDSANHKIELFYACSNSWSYDLEEYSNLLESKGYTVTDDYATKDNYKVVWYGEEVYTPGMLVIYY